MVAFSPDGKTFVLATSDREKGPGRLQLFDALTGKQKALLAEAPKASIFFPAYSPDGKRVVAEVRELGEAASVAKIWDTVSGKELAVLAPAERSIVLYPAFSPDGQFVTAITNKGAGHVWDAATGTIVLSHRFGEKGNTREIIVSPDGRLAAAVGTDPVTLINNLTVTGTGSGTLTLNGVVAGAAFGLADTGVGTVVLTAANTYTGATSVSQGATIDIPTIANGDTASPLVLPRMPSVT